MERSIRMTDGKCLVKGLAPTDVGEYAGEEAGQMTGPEAAARRPTIYDVAHRAGVSKSLVSQVLQENPRVSAARRDAVLAAMVELGYRPNRAATMLASRRAMSVEVVIDDYRNLSFVGLLAGIRSELATQGYHLSVTEARLNAHLSRERQASLLATNLDGLVIAAEADDTLIDAWSGPTVVAGWRDRIPAGADLVANDDELGGRIAVDHLLRLGHRRLGHLSGTGGPALHRRAGFRSRISEAGIDGRVVGENLGTAEEDGYRAAGELLDSHPETTAVFAANDTMALGALAAIRARGLSVPADVSLIGYDNSPLAQSRYLEITSIDDRSETVGAAAGRALLSRIQNPATEAQRTLIEPALVVRATTAPPRT
jgi:DNA-binding LacI/PurR family transcriptional regulator